MPTTCTALCHNVCSTPPAPTFPQHPPMSTMPHSMSHTPSTLWHLAPTCHPCTYNPHSPSTFLNLQCPAHPTPTTFTPYDAQFAIQATICALCPTPYALMPQCHPSFPCPAVVVVLLAQKLLGHFGWIMF